MSKKCSNCDEANVLSGFDLCYKCMAARNRELEKWNAVLEKEKSIKEELKEYFKDKNIQQGKPEQDSSESKTDKKQKKQENKEQENKKIKNRKIWLICIFAITFVVGIVLSFIF